MTLRERLKKAFASKDEGSFTAVLDELPEKDESTPVVIHNHLSTRDAEKKDDEDDDKDKDDKKTHDALDSRMTKMEDAHKDMAKDVKMIKDKVMKDADKEDDEDEEDKKKKTEDDEANAKNTKIEGSLQEEAPPGTGDRAAKAKDSAYLEDSFADTVALAEIIAPGVKIPTFDKKLDPKKTYDTICRFRRSVLDLASAQPEIRGFIDEVLGGHELKELSCNRVRDVFRAVGTFAKNRNNNTNRSGSLDGNFGTPVKGVVSSIAELNRKNAEYYK